MACLEESTPVVSVSTFLISVCGKTSRQQLMTSQKYQAMQLFMSLVVIDMHAITHMLPSRKKHDTDIQ